MVLDLRFKAIINVCRTRQSCVHLYGYEEDVQGIWFLRGRQRLPLTLKFGYLHPFPIEKGIEAVHLSYCHKQHIPMTIFNGLIVDSAQVVSAQKILFGEE